ncbi:hypothetical protein AAFF_G00116440 [Aldrovandia affinis]|uniref:Uncharacterized protein n=1 Tax=Aldrovandia affinis TaxID=143900 RepID=A0AAD7WXL4_9TELE|nr:hypothetical protein AAFF_G00116440 [Aldrovandia affinis]
MCSAQSPAPEVLLMGFLLGFLLMAPLAARRGHGGAEQLPSKHQSPFCHVTNHVTSKAAQMNRGRVKMPSLLLSFLPLFSSSELRADVQKMLFRVF